MRQTRLIAVAAAVLLLGLPVAAQPTDEAWPPPDRHRYAILVGAQEVPAISTYAIGKFALHIDYHAGRILWEMAYDRIEGVQAAHLHFGQRGANGGVMAVLCTNISTSPTNDVPMCPDGPGHVRGVIEARNIIGPTAQGIEPEELRAAIYAIRMGLVYVNVHTAEFQSGEIRGQLRHRYPSLSTNVDLDSLPDNDPTGVTDIWSNSNR